MSDEGASSVNEEGGQAGNTSSSTQEHTEGTSDPVAVS